MGPTATLTGVGPWGMAHVEANWSSRCEGPFPTPCPNCGVALPFPQPTLSSDRYENSGAFLLRFRTFDRKIFADALRDSHVARLAKCGASRHDV